MAPDAPIVLFDGVCGLCSRAVDFVLEHDPGAQFRFAPLQGETAHRYVEDASTLQTLVLIEPRADGGVEVSRESRAWFRILQRIGGPWRVVAWLRFMPRTVTDAVYRWVARSRYRWFGKLDACRLPTPDEAPRFLA
jgi:predicted DCC family thiol-disulfide oxidoreductase YuxK